MIHHQPDRSLEPRGWLRAPEVLKRPGRRDPCTASMLPQSRQCFHNLWKASRRLWTAGDNALVWSERGLVHRPGVNQRVTRVGFLHWRPAGIGLSRNPSKYDDQEETDRMSPAAVGSTVSTLIEQQPAKSTREPSRWLDESHLFNRRLNEGKSWLPPRLVCRVDRAGLKVGVREPPGSLAPSSQPTSDRSLIRSCSQVRFKLCSRAAFRG